MYFYRDLLPLDMFLLFRLFANCWIKIDPSRLLATANDSYIKTAFFNEHKISNRFKMKFRDFYGFIMVIIYQLNFKKFKNKIFEWDIKPQLCVLLEHFFRCSTCVCSKIEFRFFLWCFNKRVVGLSLGYTFIRTFIIFRNFRIAALLGNRNRTLIF